MLRDGVHEIGKASICRVKRCCNLYQSFVSHVTIFVILRSYIVQARKSLVQIDQLTGGIKTPVQLCCFQLFDRHVNISTKPRDTKLENDWLKPCNKRQLVERIEPCSIFVQQRSTTFNMLNGIFQHSTSHGKLFNFCWTAVALYFVFQLHLHTMLTATFVAQQMLNRVSFA